MISFKLFTSFEIIIIYNWIFEETFFRGKVLESLLRIAGDPEENPVGTTPTLSGARNPVNPVIQTRGNPVNPVIQAIGNPVLTAVQTRENPALNNFENLDDE